MFSVLLDIGEQEGWITAHVSSVRVTTPYDNDTVIMHEGASGGGKSEMCQELHHEDDGRMAVADAEASWFVRVDNLRRYGENVDLERAIIHPSQRLVLFSIEGVPDTTALRWEHVLDSTGEPCPNPRVVIPRAELPGVLSEPEPVDVRTFCVRMPACTKDKPTYGIMGMTHFVPPSIAWLWRLIAPRGDKTPSIGESADAVRAVRERTHRGHAGRPAGAAHPAAPGDAVLGGRGRLRRGVPHSQRLLPQRAPAVPHPGPRSTGPRDHRDVSARRLRGGSQRPYPHVPLALSGVGACWTIWGWFSPTMHHRRGRWMGLRWWPGMNASAIPRDCLPGTPRVNM